MHRTVAKQLEAEIGRLRFANRPERHRLRVGSSVLFRFVDSISMRVMEWMREHLKREHLKRRFAAPAKLTPELAIGASMLIMIEATRFATGVGQWKRSSRPQERGRRTVPESRRSEGRLVRLHRSVLQPAPSTLVRRSDESGGVRTTDDSRRVSTRPRDRIKRGVPSMRVRRLLWTVGVSTLSAACAPERF